MADRALPSAVRGPVEQPPWFRHLALPGIGLRMHGSPARVLAPQVTGPHPVVICNVIAEPHDARTRARPRVITVQPVIHLFRQPATGNRAASCLTAL